jgi:abortive phage resistance protein AbiGi (putative antitoxin)
MNNNNISPGTVSKIVWHFTGGPIWDENTKKQKEEIKSESEAFANLYSILKSKELQVGKYKEILHYNIPEEEIYDLDQNKHYHEKNISASIESTPICCAAEIPIQHLSYHSNRYGKFAIGFHRESLLKHNFNPVLYTLDNGNFINHILSAHEISKFVGKDINTSPEVIKSCMNLNSKRIYYIENVLQTIIAFIKTISNNEFDTIYCEREWRSIKSFKFTFDDVAFIILPKSYFAKNDFNNNIEIISKELCIPRSLPIVPWEDLIEH